MSYPFKQFDAFLIQSLMPLFANEDHEIQMATLRVFSSQISKFQSASKSEVHFAWEYFFRVLRSGDGVSFDV